MGTIIDVLDEFGAENEFHGGIDWSGRRDPARQLDTERLGQVQRRQHASERASRRLPEHHGTQTSPTDDWPGGMLAQPTNMGSYDRDVTAWIPEFGVTAGYDVRNWLRLTIGYNILWISNVALAGDQIDRVVNPTQFGGNPLIGPARPAFTASRKTSTGCTA